MVGEPRQLYLPSIPYSLIDMHSYKENKEYKLISIFLSIDKWLFIKSIEYQIEILFMKYIIFSVWGVWNENLVHGEGKKILKKIKWIGVTSVFFCIKQLNKL